LALLNWLLQIVRSQYKGLIILIWHFSLIRDVLGDVQKVCGLSEVFIGFRCFVFSTL
jgi:hypothetical protein